MKISARFRKTAAIILLGTVCILTPLSAQDSFGFEETASPSPVTLGGKISAAAVLFTEDAERAAELGDAELGELFAGTLNISGQAANTEVLIALNIDPSGNGAALSLDEAYFIAYLGKIDLTAGLRKLSWGRADSSGPLDVTNPLDLTDLTVTDSLSRKIARPMLHLSWHPLSFTALQAVFIPSFAGHRLALEGRWQPSQIRDLTDMYEQLAAIPGSPLEGTVLDPLTMVPHTAGLEYAQAGLRFTTTAASTDLGLQYYYGNLSRPAVTVTFPVSPLVPEIAVAYNRYHQIGLDAAAVRGGFNIRAEAAANITSDLRGDDGAVYNPALLWSLGFDRPLFAGITVNAQGNGSWRLMHSEVGEAGADAEGGTEASSTTVTVQLSRSFFKDRLSIKTTGLYNIEAADFLILPELVWTSGEFSARFSVGIFGGEADGELGQYGDNNYLKLSLETRF